MAGYVRQNKMCSGLAKVIADALVRLGYDNAYDYVPPTYECCEPIVVRQHEFECGPTLPDGSALGTERFRVYAVMDTEKDARSTAAGVVCSLHGVLPGELMEVEGHRVRGIEVDEPYSLGRDSSGRWVYSVDVVLSVVRDFVEEW